MVKMILREDDAILLVFRGADKIPSTFPAMEHWYNCFLFLSSENRRHRKHFSLPINAEMSHQSHIQRFIFRKRDSPICFVLVLIREPHNTFPTYHQPPVPRFLCIKLRTCRKPLSAMGTIQRIFSFSQVVCNVKDFSSVGHLALPPSCTDSFIIAHRHCCHKFLIPFRLAFSFSILYNNVTCYTHYGLSAHNNDKAILRGP